MKELRFTFGFLLLFFLGNLSAQDSLNTEVLYNYDAPGHTYNDCWGYVDDAGNEYAIVGTKTKVYFYDITDPGNTTLVDEFSNNNPSGLSMSSTTWRDFKTYGDKAYACADQSNNIEGLLVFDMSDLPNSVSFESQTTDFFKRAHNIFVDTVSGWLYVAGGRLVNNTLIDVIVIDLTADPDTLLANASINGGYIHDIYVRDDIAYCNSGGNGFFVYDFSTPSAPVYLGSLVTGEYNHSAWVTEDGKYAFYAEEFPIGLPLGVIDLTDFGDMEIVETFKEPLLAPDHMNNRPHNPYVRDDLLIVSYYHDGVQIFDISNPLNPEVVGYYDTYHQNTYYPNDYSGCWGVYPYFPSGLIIATDQTNGFFVLEYSEAPLPVELTNFTAKLEKDKVKLDWTTASEIDSKLFEIQKSTNGADFETISRIDAAGNSDIKIDYEIYDENPFVGDNYYRLKQVDLDGKFEYSDIEVVRFGTSPFDIFPTIITSDNTLNIVFSENEQDIQIQVFSIQGQLLQTEVFTAENGQKQEMRLDDLYSGTFIVLASNGVYQESKRIVVVR